MLDDLRHEILTTRLRPGETLNEPALAARYGVSKTPVREALRLLVQEGWILNLPRKGYLVRPLGLQEIRDVFALRRMIEPPLAAEAARRCGPAEAARLAAIVEAQRAATEFEQLVGLASAFHLTIGELSGNLRAVPILTQLVNEVCRLMYLMPRLEESLRSVTEIDGHERVSAAIARGEADAAAHAMDAHLALAGESLAHAFGAAGGAAA